MPRYECAGCFGGRWAGGVYRVDESVGGLDVTQGRVERQAEPDGVVQARLEAHRPLQHHIAEEGETQERQERQERQETQERQERQERQGHGEALHIWMEHGYGEMSQKNVNIYTFIYIYIQWHSHTLTHTHTY